MNPALACNHRLRDAKRLVSIVWVLNNPAPLRSRRRGGKDVEKPMVSALGKAAPRNSSPKRKRTPRGPDYEHPIL